ncbi:hypothetical protein [Aliarcobacter butzleri]|uniref:hypothetical protein n=1 Tax=Aliarcobacter butzleri TaxID=28197 RepID=UPI002B25060D|nr:hypothetical protein [Aliarcobacter butzleri]
MDSSKKQRGFKQQACRILDISTRSYSNFNKQNKPIIKLLEKYFIKEELQEFLETGEIEKQEIVKDLSLSDLNSLNKLKEQFVLDEIKRTEEKLEELKALRNNIIVNK